MNAGRTRGAAECNLLQGQVHGASNSRFYLVALWPKR